MKGASTTETTKTLGGRMDEAALAKILDRLNTLSAGSKDRKSGRGDERFIYRKTVQVELRQPSGGGVSTRVMTRDLSKDGISFLHSAYVHVGTVCKFQLVTTHNNWQMVDGKVTRCAYVEGGWHIVAVKFAKSIDLAAFAAGVTPRRILVVDDDPGIRKLFGVLLSSMRSEAVFAENGEEAIAKIGAELFDLVFMDIDMPVLDGEKAICKMRESGYMGKVVATTAMSAPGDRERLMALGFSGYLSKPIVKKALSDLISSIEEEPLFSTLSGEEGFKSIINEFVEGMSARVRAMEQALAEQNLVGLATLARILKGEAGSYGFEPITQAAQSVEDALSSKQEIGKIRKQASELIRLCAAARPTSKSQAAG